MSNNLEQIKKLRNHTGAGIGNVKEALEVSGGDFDKAVLYLREKGLAKAAKRSDKTASNGFIAHYIHGEGNLGVIVELNSETDFASRNEKFRELAFNLALHIAASDPQYISVDDIPADVVESEREMAAKGVDTNKPKEIIEKIIDGKMNKFYEETVLLNQVYVKDDSKKVSDLINEAVASIGEKIEVGRFCRMKINETGCSCGL